MSLEIDTERKLGSLCCKINDGEKLYAATFDIDSNTKYNLAVSLDTSWYASEADQEIQLYNFDIRQ